MSELDNENVGRTDDNEVDESETIEEDTDTTMPAAEIIGQSTLKMMIRAFLDLFAVEKNNLILTVINDITGTKPMTSGNSFSMSDLRGIMIQ